jgi:hypothetical protein
MAFSREPVAAWDDALSAVRVAPARHGLGVFARRVIVVDEIIGEVTGTIIHEEGYGSEYCIDLDPSRVLEPDEPFRYVNHSCDPNCEIFSWDETDGDVTSDRVWLTALRVIQPGEELTIDYAWEADAAIPCGCGSANCRGWIVDEAELATLPVEANLTTAPHQAPPCAARSRERRKVAAVGPSSRRPSNRGSRSRPKG